MSEASGTDRASASEPGGDGVPGAQPPSVNGVSEASGTDRASASEPGGDGVPGAQPPSVNGVSEASGTDRASGTEDVLDVRKLTVDFDGFKAVNGVDLTFLQGRLHFLIGPNGAGKTTLVDALTGLVRGSGEAVFRDRDLLTMKSHKIVRHGIGRTFQTATVFERLSVLQNLDIAAGVHRRTITSIFARGKVPERVEEALETIGLTSLAHRQAGILAHGQKQWLEVGMLLVQDAKVMFLDETVAGMSAAEREETGDLLKRIVADRTIVVIEHDMEFMRRYADFVTVMHSGAVLAEGTVAEIQADEHVQQVYLGTVTEVAARA